jgi:hypothetical protein
MMQRVEETTARGQRRIRKLQRRLGGSQEGSETSSIETQVITAEVSCTGRAEERRDCFFRSETGQRDLRPKESLALLHSCEQLYMMNGSYTISVIGD